MSLELPRADNLKVLRAICHYIAGDSRGYVSTNDLSKWLKDSAKRELGHEWKRTRIYHYRSAAKELHLITISRSRVMLSKYGCEMVCSNYCPEFSDPLTEMEKSVFFKIIPKYDAVCKYLSYYMPDGEPPANINEFLVQGRPIQIVRAGSDSFLLTAASGKQVALSRSEKLSVSWTLFNWFRQLDLVDDVYKENPASFMLREPEVRIFYPTRYRHISTIQLERLLNKEIIKSNHSASYFYIPDLLSKLCATAGIPKLLFLNGITELYKHDPIHYHLEMMSSLRSDTRCEFHYNYRNFPEVDGVLRSHICIRSKTKKDFCYERN